MNNNKVFQNHNNTQNKIPSAKAHQRSSSIPIRKILQTNPSNISKISRETSRERTQPASRNLRTINEERIEQTEKLESDINKLEKENSLLIKRNNDFELYLDTLKSKLQKLNFEFKDAKENILIALRNKNNLVAKLNKIQKEIEFSQREFEMFRVIKEYKINTVSNNIQYAKNIKEDRKNSFAKKIESEMQQSIKIRKDLKETKSKIKKMRLHLASIEDKRNKSADKIFKEKHEMERFLINI